MQGVQQLAIFQGLRSRLPDLLAPYGSAHDHHRVRIVFPDNRDHFPCIAFNAVPGGIAIGLIADLIEHMGLILKAG